VRSTPVCPSAIRPPTPACARGHHRPDPCSVHRRASDLYDRRTRLCVMAPAGGGAPGQSHPRHPGQCALSAVRLGPSCGPRVRACTPLCADVFAQLEPDRTIVAICQKAVPVLDILPRECIMSTGHLHGYSTRFNAAPRSVEAIVNRTRSHVRRSCQHWRRIDSVHRADDKSSIEGRVEYTRQEWRHGLEPRGRGHPCIPASEVRAGDDISYTSSHCHTNRGCSDRVCVPVMAT
jgi:hypothetical protein